MLHKAIITRTGSSIDLTGGLISIPLFIYHMIISKFKILFYGK